MPPSSTTIPARSNAVSSSDRIPGTPPKAPGQASKRNVASKDVSTFRRDADNNIKDLQLPKRDANNQKEVAHTQAVRPSSPRRSAMKADALAQGKKDSAMLRDGRINSPRGKRGPMASTSSVTSSGVASGKKEVHTKQDRTAFDVTAAPSVAPPATASPTGTASVTSSVVRPSSVPPLACAQATSTATASAAASVPAPASASAPASAPAPTPAPDEIDEANDCGEGEEEMDEEVVESDQQRRQYLSPVRLRMGWRRNGELELRTHELQHIIDMLKPSTPGQESVEGADSTKPSRWAKSGTRSGIEAHIRHLETQQARMGVLEREVEAQREAKHQAISSRTEMVKRLEEEKKRSDGLEQQLVDLRSKLVRAHRQIELLRNPHAQPAEDEAENSDKPRPIHMRLGTELKKREEKLDAMRHQIEQGRTYAPRIDPTSAHINKSAARARPVAESVVTIALPAGSSPATVAAPTPVVASESTTKSGFMGSQAEDDFDSAAPGPSKPALLAQVAKLTAEAAREKKLRELAEASMSRTVANEKKLAERREELELQMQRMASKEREQKVEVDIARKEAKDAKNECEFVRKLAEAAQVDAAQQAEEARQMARKTAAWEADRVKLTNAMEEAQARAKEAEERSLSAEQALENVAAATTQSDSDIRGARKSRGGATNLPINDQAQKKQQSAKLEKHRLAAEEERRTRQRVERELQRALDEKTRLQEKLDQVQLDGKQNAGNPRIQSGQNRIISVGAAPATANEMNESSSTVDRSANAPSKNIGKVNDMHRVIRFEIEEGALCRELSEVESELHRAKLEAHAAAQSIHQEKKLRAKAEAALDRFNRISALQKAATDALHFTMERSEDETSQVTAQKALSRAIADVSGLRSGNSTPRTPRNAAVESPRMANRSGSVDASGIMDGTIILGSARGTPRSSQISASPRSARSTSFAVPPSSARQSEAALSSARQSDVALTSARDIPSVNQHLEMESQKTDGDAQKPVMHSPAAPIAMTIG